MRIENGLVAHQLQLETSRLSSICSDENCQETLQKVKDFAIGFFKGVLQGMVIVLFVLSIGFLAGVGFSFGAEKVAEIFEKLRR